MIPQPQTENLEPTYPAWWKSSLGVRCFSLSAVGFLLSRFLYLGFHSPWNDEVANWAWASQLPGGAVESSHWLTYYAIRLFTLLSNSIAFARLPMALILSVSSLWFASVIWNRISPAVGKTTLLLLLFNPMLTFYSVDANHYAFVFFSGVVCAVASLYLSLLKSWGRRLLVVTLCCAGVWIASLSHPFALIPLVGFGAAFLADLFQRPVVWLGGITRGRGEAARLIRFGKGLSLTLGFLAIVIGILGIMKVQEARVEEMLVGGVYFRMTPAFLADLAANFFGAYLEFSVWDYVFGMTAAGACVLGFVLTARSCKPASLVGICGFAQFCVVAYFFSTLEAIHYFHIRYIIFLLPSLILGVSLLSNITQFQVIASKESVPVGEEGHSPRGRALQEASKLLVSLFILRWFVWGLGFYTGHFQPLTPAFDYVASELPKRSIVATRSKFLSQSYRFLELTEPRYSNIQVEWLGDVHPGNQFAASRAAYLATTRQEPVFTLEMKKYDNESSEAYYAFLKKNPLIKEFASSVTRDFFPYDRSLELRSIGLNVAFGQLPIAGSDAIQLFPQNTQLGFYPEGENASNQLILSPGAGASYYLQATSKETDSVWLDIQLRGPSENPLLLMGVLEPQVSVPLKPNQPISSVTIVESNDSPNSATIYLWDLSNEKGLQSLELPAPRENARLSLFYCMSLTPSLTSWDSSRKITDYPRPLWIDGLRPAETGSGYRAIKPRSLNLMDSNPEGLVRPTSTSLYGTETPKVATGIQRWTVVPNPADRGSFLSETVQVQTINNGTKMAGVFVLFHFETTGLSSQGVDLKIVHEQAGQTINESVLAGARTSYSFGPAWVGAYVPAYEESFPIEASYQLVRQKVTGPQFGRLTAEDPRFFLIPEE